MTTEDKPDSSSEETTIIGRSASADESAAPVPPVPQETAISSKSATRYVPPAATARSAEVLRKLEPGVKVRKYRIIRELGRGGQGRVFLARDEELGRQVALKTIAALPLLDEATFQRFHNEGLAAARLRHPNVVQLYDVFEQDGIPFLAMEYVEGETLLSAAKGGRLARTRLLEIMVKVCEAMGSAHRDGLIHRDLKPQNIMITKDGEPKVMDFGLAKSLLGGDDFVVATMDGQLVGSPAYMSPEQASGVHDKIGPATDVYALGTVLYQCLSGRLPHVADTAASTMMRIIRDEPPPLKSIDPTIGEELNAICMKSLEKEPRDRYADGAKMAADLRSYLAGEPIQARPTSTAVRWMKMVQRNKDVALVSGAALTIMAVALSLGVTFYSRQNDRRETDTLRTKFLTAASYATLQFVPEEIALVRNADDRNGSVFTKLVGQLNDIRRKARDPAIQEAYIVRRENAADNQPATYVYVADADAGLPDADPNRRPGSLYVAHSDSPLVRAFNTGTTEVQMQESRLGTTMSGFAPITDKESRPVAVLAVFVQAPPARAETRSIMRTTAQMGGLAAILFSGFTVTVGVRVLRGRRGRR